MQLKQWIKEERGRAAALATYLAENDIEGKKISPNVVYQWCSEDAKVRRPIPVKWCRLIENFTKSEVMRWDCRPSDWHQLWPELGRRAGAPPPPTKGG